jgi:hypothetical protein
MLKKILRLIFAAFAFLTIFAALCFIVLMVLIYFAHPFAGKTNTNVADYSSMVKSKCNGVFMYDVLLEHFPTQIPKSATDVKMYYHGGALKGDYNFQLLLNLPEEEFKKELAKFSGKEIKKFIGGNRRDHRKAEGGLPTTYFHIGDDKKTFSDDYVILLLLILPTPEHLRIDSAKWGGSGSYRDVYSYRNCGIAYNEKTKTIVYWANSCQD